MINIKDVVDRVRSHFSMGGNKSYVTDMPGCLNTDLRTLGEAYLAEHPSDDDEPVTEEWLHSIAVMGSDCYEIGHVEFVFEPECGWTAFAEVNGHSAWLLDTKTRGQVRLLCRALNIDLKE